MLPEADVSERFHTDWAHMKEHGHMLFVADAGSGSIEAFLDNDITTRTVQKCLSAFLARFEVPKIRMTVDPNLWAMTSKDDGSFRELTEYNHRSATQKQMD